MKLKFDLSFLTSFLIPKDLLGVDIGSYSVKIVQLKSSQNKFSLVKSSVLNLPEEMIYQEVPPVEKRQVIASLIKNYILKEKISTRNAVSSVSGSSVIVRYVKFPKITKEELSKSIQFEAEPYIPFDIKEVNVGFYILGDVTEEGVKKTETVLVAAKKEIVQSKIDILQDAGLTPAIIDVDAFALESCYEINREPEIQETVIIVNIGANVTNMVIIENGISRVVRDILIGGNTFTRTLQRNLDCDFKTAEELKKLYGLLVTPEEKEEALKQDNKEALRVSTALTGVAHDLLGEIHRSIDFFYSQRGEQYTINRLLLSGGGSKMKNLDKYFQQELKLQTEIFDPLNKVENYLEPKLYSELSIGVGLGTRTLKEK